MSSQQKDLLQKAKDLSQEPGVYLMKDAERKVLYVGKAVSLRARVSSYFQESASHEPKTQKLVEKICDFEVIECESEVEALLSEARLIKDLQPQFNIMLKDGKSFPYIEITKDDDFPLIRVTRANHVKKNIYYGPFTAAGALKPALSLLQKIFKFRTCEMKIKEGDPRLKGFSPCLLYHIKRCTAPCAGRISQENYGQDIKNLRQVLEGHVARLTRELKTKMKDHSQALEYERAAEMRDQIRALEGLKTAGPLGTQPELEIAPVNALEGMEQLKEVLHLDFVPRSLEGFDIAHLQGQQTVASLVSFVDGRPFKEGYRHFRIKTPTGGDDFAALHEVLMRRYKRLKEESQPFPDLVLIDGGKGQLNVAQKVFEELNCPKQVFLSLAKKDERIYVPWRERAIHLTRYDTALRVLQHLRDEAHRFAQRYHHLLRDKNFIKDV